MFLYQTTINSSKRPHKTTKTKPTVTFNPQIEDPGLGLSDCVGPVNKYEAANTTKKPYNWTRVYSIGYCRHPSN